MPIEIKVPPVGESINEVTLAKWLKNEGDFVQQDEMLCELESEKATFELNAEKPGKISLVAKEGDVLKIGDVVCRIETDAAMNSEQPGASDQPSAISNQHEKPQEQSVEEKNEKPAKERSSEQKNQKNYA